MVEEEKERGGGSTICDAVRSTIGLERAIREEKEVAEANRQGCAHVTEKEVKSALGEEDIDWRSRERYYLRFVRKLTIRET